MNIVKHRDLTLTALPCGTLVTACDSCGAVGEKPADVLSVPPYYAGRFTARVALMEVLAFGAQPVTVADTLACEMEPTGQEILRGVRDELAAAGVGPEVLTGSTEENFPTQMTALGITVAGWTPAPIGWTPSRSGDVVYCIGTPQVGAEVVLEDNRAIASYDDLNLLHALDGVREVIPTGSHGIRWEAEQLAAYNRLCFAADDAPGPDLDQSTGPATCVLAAADPACCAAIEAMPRAVRIGVLRSCPPGVSPDSRR